MTTFRTLAALSIAMAALVAQSGPTAAQQPPSQPAPQQRVNEHSNTARGGADVKQVAGRKIGNVTTRGEDRQY